MRQRDVAALDAKYTKELMMVLSDVLAMRFFIAVGCTFSLCLSVSA